MSDSITSQWWPDDRVDATVSRDFILKTLDAELCPRLFSHLSFGENLTDDTYIDWILERSRKIYLILLEINLQHQIFHLVDSGYDDADLPITRENTANLRLSPVVKDIFSNWRFTGAQQRFLIRGIPQGEHIQYQDRETIPVETQKNYKLPISLPDAIQAEKVIHAGKVCQELLRLKFNIGEGPYYQDAGQIVREVKALRPFAHEHILSVFGSYSVGDTVNVLVSGAPECTLSTFLDDRSASFKRLNKDMQLSVLLNWPHCLASGLAWLHAQGQCHGAIRPSNILIDSTNRIFLGLFDAFSPLIPYKAPNNLEGYLYDSPEVRPKTSPATRTPQPLTRPATAKQDSTLSSHAAGWTPASFFTRAPLSKSRSKSSLGRSASTSSSTSSHSSVNRKKISSLSSQSTTSTSSRDINPSSPPAHIMTALTNAGRKEERNSGGNGFDGIPLHKRYGPASDVFCLASISLDIITCFCKKKQSKFIDHRSANNRTPGFHGGSIPDASFHLAKNADQVFSWMDILEREASKQKSPHYRAVAPLLAVVKDMFARNPEHRPSSMEVTARYARAICSVASDFEPHCRFDPEVLVPPSNTTETHENNSVARRHSSYSSFSTGQVASLPASLPVRGEMVEQQNLPKQPDLEPETRASSCYSFQGDESDYYPKQVPQYRLPSRSERPKPMNPWSYELDIIDDEDISLEIDLEAGVVDLNTDLSGTPPSPKLPSLPPPPTSHGPWTPNPSLGHPTLPNSSKPRSMNRRVPGDHLVPPPLSLFPPRSAPLRASPPLSTPEPLLSPTSVSSGYCSSQPPTPKETGSWGHRIKAQQFPRPPMAVWGEREMDQSPMNWHVPTRPHDSNTDYGGGRGYMNFSRHRSGLIER